MMKKTTLNFIVMIITMGILLLPGEIFADSRSQKIKLICGSQLDHNTTLYVPNFVATMENISTQMRVSGFGIAATGSGPDTNYGLAQCYGHLSLSDCVFCYDEARTVLPQCYPVNGGRIYLDGCFMRAENYTFYEEYTGPNDHAVCGKTIRRDSAFQVSVRRAMSKAVSAAPRNNGYGRAQVSVAGRRNGSAYVLADCLRTINASACRACLKNASASILSCLPASEGRALNTGCFMRYSDIDLLNPIPIHRNGSSRGRVTDIVLETISAAAVVTVGVIIGFYTWKNRSIEKKRKGDALKLVKTLDDMSLIFKHSTLERATASFDEANKVGRGGFGTVYKGVLPDGREIAVKRLFLNNKHRAADLYNEVNILSSVEHKNLVRLLGCSCSGPESLLVYEYLQNKSLDRFIFDSSKGKALNWDKRLEIITGTAEGLVYLHEKANTRIIHRDIKASNILLDSRLRAKIADFGLARTFQGSKSHISTAIAGTLGYLPPEYLAHGQLTEKVDVYSFGVLLLEIVTGKQNNKSKTMEYADSLITIAWQHFQRRTVEELFDPNLMLQNYSTINIKSEILRVVHVALLCTQKIPWLRPTMSMALLMLVGKEHLPAPTSPPFIDEKTLDFSNTSVDTSPILNHGTRASVANISQSAFLPR